MPGAFGLSSFQLSSSRLLFGNQESNPFSSRLYSHAKHSYSENNSSCTLFNTTLCLHIFLFSLLHHSSSFMSALSSHPFRKNPLLFLSETFLLSKDLAAKIYIELTEHKVPMQNYTSLCACHQSSDGEPGSSLLP